MASPPRATSVLSLWRTGRCCALEPSLTWEDVEHATASILAVGVTTTLAPSTEVDVKFAKTKEMKMYTVPLSGRGMVMKTSLPIAVLVLLFTPVLAFSTAKNGDPSAVAEDNPGPPSDIQINFRSPLSVWLKINEVSKTLSKASMPIRGAYFPWIGDASLRWEVDVPEKDDYEVYLTANVTEAGDGTKITIEAGGRQADFTIFETSGPFPGGENFKIQEALNFERKKLSGSIPLEAGKQIITVSTSGIEKEEVLFHIRGIELLPVSKKEMIAAEEARAISARASFDWMAETGYGLMFHWTSGTPQRDGSRKSFEEAVNDFDVEKFVNMVEETGAGYVIFPIGHAESYCPAPIESWERIHPGQTTKRDLIEELANALNERDIRLICYINGPLAFEYPKRVEITPEIVQNFVANFKDILPELGMRYKDKIAGYWFDTMILKIPFEDFFHAAKVGNKDRLICLNAFYGKKRHHGRTIGLARCNIQLLLR